MKKVKQLLEYLALAKAIDNPEGAEVLADAGAEILEELVTEHAEKEGITIDPVEAGEEDLDIEEEIADEDDITWDEDEDEDEESEDIMANVSLWEDEEGDEEDEDEEDEEEDEDEDEEIVEIDEEEDEEEKPPGTEEEVPTVKSKAARRAISIANRLYASGDTDSENLAKNILKFVVKKNK
jgi:Flp pilus assembly CpaE family ATPase